jgi:hypothetical protein
VGGEGGGYHDSCSLVFTQTHTHTHTHLLLLVKFAYYASFLFAFFSSFFSLLKIHYPMNHHHHRRRHNHHVYDDFDDECGGGTFFPFLAEDLQMEDHTDLVCSNLLQHMDTFLLWLYLTLLLLLCDKCAVGVADWPVPYG